MKLFIFGSTGDLVKKKVISALQSLDKKDFEIYALGRKDLDNSLYHESVCKSNCTELFKKRLNYINVNFESENICESCIEILDKDEINYFYIALPPEQYSKVLIYLNFIKKNGFKIRILIEKPFGSSFDNSVLLFNLLSRLGLEKDIFLADHYLFKKEILKIKKENFKKLDLIFIEPSVLTNRFNFYDSTGQLKDMVQGHLINLLLRILPDNLSINDLIIEEYKRGQYGNGIDKGYVMDVNKQSQTETFVFIKLRYKDSIIRIYSGKEFKDKISKIIIDDRELNIEDQNSYGLLFKGFFNNKKEKFPTKEQTLFSWKLIDNILKKQSDLFYYEKGIRFSKLNFFS